MGQTAKIVEVDPALEVDEDDRQIIRAILDEQGGKQCLQELGLARTRRSTDHRMGTICDQIDRLSRPSRVTDRRDQTRARGSPSIAERIGRRVGQADQVRQSSLAIRLPIGS